MIREATPVDVPAILALTRELARYEDLEHELELSADRLGAHLFGTEKICSALVATPDDGGAAPIGYALFFPTYSTFKTRPCLYLEDLYVTPNHRGRGHGRALLATVAAAAQAMGCPRLDWSVLSWNRLAVDFYGELGASLLPDWRTCRLEGDALARVAVLADKIL